MFPIKYSDAILKRFPEIYDYTKDNLFTSFIYYLINSNQRQAVGLSDWLQKQVLCAAQNPSVNLKTISSKITYTTDYDDQVINVLKYVKKNLLYVGDEAHWKSKEHWSTAEETITSMTGDCVANYEEIYTDLGIKKVGDLEEGDIVMSYDFENKNTCFRRITKIWEKGELPIKRVHLRNGQHIDITGNHPLWARINQKGKSQYGKIYLNDIDLTKWWKRKLPIAKKIPYRVNDIKWINEDLCYIIGHYIAEGWKEKNGYKVQSSGYELIEYIIPLLEKNNIPFTEYKNNSGVPCINFLNSPFKEYLKFIKENSFDIHIPEEIFHLPSNKLKKLLDGMYLGDGHNGNYPDKRGWISNKGKCYSTSSEQLARDIQRIGLQIGESYHIWKQEKHGGVGKKPIWRITYNPESHFLQDYGYKDISEVSISWIEDLGKTKMRDFEVAYTHTFIFKNGLISHQCEDGSVLIYVLCRMKGVPANRLLLWAGNVQATPTAPLGGHCSLFYKPKNYPLSFVNLDWCYFPSNYPVKDRDLFLFDGKAINEFDDFGQCQSVYKDTWFMFNEDVGYSYFIQKLPTVTK